MGNRMSFEEVARTMDRIFNSLAQDPVVQSNVHIMAYLRALNEISADLMETILSMAKYIHEQKGDMVADDGKFLIKEKEGTDVDKSQN